MPTYTFQIRTKPLAKKNERAVGRHGKIYTRRPAAESEREIIREMATQRPACPLPILCPVIVEIRLRPGRHDIVNQAETVLDALQGGHGSVGLILKNDRQAEEITIRRDSKLPEGIECIVEVTPFPTL